MAGFTTFHPFSRLPLEIRTMIWIESLPTHRRISLDQPKIRNRQYLKLFVCKEFLAVTEATFTRIPSPSDASRSFLVDMNTDRIDHNLVQFMKRSNPLLAGKSKCCLVTASFYDIDQVMGMNSTTMIELEPQVEEVLFLVQRGTARPTIMIEPYQRDDYIRYLKDILRSGIWRLRMPQSKRGGSDPAIGAEHKRLRILFDVEALVVNTTDTETREIDIESVTED